MAPSGPCLCGLCREKKDKGDGTSSKHRNWPSKPARTNRHLGDEPGDGVRRKKDRAILECLIDSGLAGLKEMRGKRPSVESDARERAG